MWKKINFNFQNIEGETFKATLIKMPNNSEYKGYVFWHPSKLVRSEGGNGYFVSFSYTDDFNFILLKNGKGKYNKKQILNELEINSQEMEKAFQVVDEKINFDLKENKNKNENSFLEIKEPEKINKKVKIKEELKKEVF